MLSHSRPWQSVPLACPLHRLKGPATHGAAGLNLGPLQGDGDAVEEDEGQDDIVKELMGGFLMLTRTARSEKHLVANF